MKGLVQSAFRLITCNLGFNQVCPDFKGVRDPGRISLTQQLRCTNPKEGNLTVDKCTANNTVVKAGVVIGAGVDATVKVRVRV